MPEDIGLSNDYKTHQVFYLTGQVVAAYGQVRLAPQDFEGLASAHF